MLIQAAAITTPNDCSNVLVTATTFRQFEIRRRSSRNGRDSPGQRLGASTVATIVTLALFLILAAMGIGKGDEVITNGGILGKVTNVGEDFMDVQVAEGVVRIRPK